MSLNKLKVLQSLEEITGFLRIDANVTGFRNLNFLSNLRAVHGSQTLYDSFKPLL